MSARLIDLLLPVRPGERRLTAVLFFHSLFAVGSFLAGRSVRDALFLVYGDRAQLPWMYVLSAAAVTVVGLLYARFAARFRRDWMAASTAGGFAVLFVVGWWLERSGAPWIYGGLYVYVEVMGALVLMQFWTLTNEIFHAREAKRLYGLIGSGGTLANIVVGLLAAKMATRFGASSLLVLCAVLLGATAVASFFAGRLGRQRVFARAAAGKVTVERRTGGAARVLASPHLRTVAGLAAVTFFTTTLVDFEFKVVAAEAYPRDQLAAWFGYFYAVVGVLALGLQLFGTGRLLQRAGVIGALAVLPLSLLLGNAWLAVAPALWAAAATKGADTLFRYSVNDATTQLLYLPVPAGARAAAKAFIDGVVKPLFIGLAGLVLIGYRAWFHADPAHLAIASLGLCAGWLVLVGTQRSHYLRTLHDTLRGRRAASQSREMVAGASSSAVLHRALESEDAREVLNALELLPQLDDIDLDHKVERLLDHPLPEIRLRALDYYAHRQTLRFANSIFRKFEDQDARVRARAIDAFCAMGRDRAVRSVRMYLQDGDPGIRAAAVVGMIRYGGLDGVLVAAEALKALITHPDAAMRQHAAKVLGSIGVRNFYQPVIELMNDADGRVRREAVHAAGVLQAPEFIQPLVQRLRSHETAREAVEALHAYGPAILPTLARVLDNRAEDPSIRRGAARVLGRLATAEAAAVACRHLEVHDEELRLRLYRALARCTRHQRGMPVDRAAVEAALQRELVHAYGSLWTAELLQLGTSPSTDAGTPRTGVGAAAAMLGGALAEDVHASEERIFLLLAVLYPDADMERIWTGIRDAGATDALRKRVNAVELLDNLLDRQTRRRLLPLLDDSPRDAKLRAAAEFFPAPPAVPEQLVAGLCRYESPWVRACAAFFARESGLGEVSGALRELSDDEVAYVREMALLATVTLDPEQGPLALARGHKDPAPVVKAQAARLRAAALSATG